jgi:protein-ribulosamine 3-kinase
MLGAVPLPIQVELKGILQADLISFSFAGGGCINHGGRLQTTTRDYFLKWNDAEKFPGMFEAEAKGLRLLKEPDAISIPEVVVHGVVGQFQFLVLEFIEAKSKQESYWEALGEQLARLHRVSSRTFGLDHNNFIGSLIQINSPTKAWIEFFIEKRLDVQLKQAMKYGKISPVVEKQFQILFQKLPSLLPEEKPSLLHGDLWSGNLITNDKGMPCLVDPAVYFGNREIELAFTELFGGFSDRFYEVYDAQFKLEPGYRDRMELYQLYPLMVHVNLFGGGYVAQVVSILKRFV